MYRRFRVLFGGKDNNKTKRGRPPLGDLVLKPVTLGLPEEHLNRLRIIAAEETLRRGGKTLRWSDIVREAVKQYLKDLERS